MKRNLLRVGFLSLFFALTTMASAATDATITWAWNDSEASSADSLGMQEAAVSSDLISNCTVTLGESLVYYESGIRSWSDWTLESGDRQYFTEVTNNSGEKITEGSDASTITLSFTVADGYKFTPSNVSMKAERDGTGGGNFDLVWNNATTITSGQLGNRHGTDDSWSDFSFNINADAATGTCTLQIVITNLDNGKSIGFADVVISGTIASENEADEEGNEETVSDEQCLYSTDFTEWVADESAPQVTTDYSNESLVFTLVASDAMPEDVSNTEKFGDYEGCLRINNQKAGDGYVTTSALNSITKVEVNYGTTAGSRGLYVYSKGDGDSDWELTFDGSGSTQGSHPVTIDVNKENCELKFVSSVNDQYVFLISLAIYGNVSSSESGTTGISNAITSSNVENGAIYNLAGQRLSKLTKGINIVNGKKILVK